MEEKAARLNEFNGARPAEAVPTPAIVLLLCKQCASISRAVLGRGEMMCPCGGQRRVLRIFEDQRRVDLPVSVERRDRRDD
jgi:hypothetical protein